MKQPGQQEGGPSTGQHANVIIPRGGRRPSGKQVFYVLCVFLAFWFFLFVHLKCFAGPCCPASQCWLWYRVSPVYSWLPGYFHQSFIPFLPPLYSVPPHFISYLILSSFHRTQPSPASRGPLRRSRWRRTAPRNSSPSAACVPSMIHPPLHHQGLSQAALILLELGRIINTKLWQTPNQQARQMEELRSLNHPKSFSFWLFQELKPNLWQLSTGPHIGGFTIVCRRRNHVDSTPKNYCNRRAMDER